MLVIFPGALLSRLLPQATKMFMHCLAVLRLLQMLLLALPQVHMWVSMDLAPQETLLFSFELGLSIKFKGRRYD